MLRMAVKGGAGLPAHVDEKDWELMPPGTSQVIADAMTILKPAASAL